MKDIKFIYWFAYYNLNSPSVRYRAHYPLKYFRSEKGGNSYLVIPSYSPGKIFLFLKAYLSALLFRKKDSLIVIQRVHSNFIYSSLLKLLVGIQKSNTVYDLDDADYLEYPAKTIHYFARHCHKISAGSTGIADYFKSFNPNVFVITSPTVDLNIVKKSRNAIFTIGWIGGFGGDHKNSLLQIVFPALRQLSFHLKLVIIGITEQEDFDFIPNYFDNCPHIKLDIPRTIDWNDETNLQNRIAQFDIGIATLTDTTFQRSKSGIKAKQYLNNGVPVLSTNLPENNRVVLDGVNGFFCESTIEFAERIRQFHQMSDEQYWAFSERARASVIHFDHQKYFDQFAKLKGE
jgi:glycosyltransferase involved in cell wall biosynthesis